MRKNLVFTPLMVLIAAGAACAQDTSSAVLAGRVTDAQNGRPLQGVRVFMESPSMLGTRSAVTDASGQFRVILLPNGEYTITYTLQGYITRRSTMRLIAGSTANGSAMLSSIGVEEATVEIIGAHAQVDKTDTVVQSSYSSDWLEKISGRGFGNINALSPGSNTSPTSTGIVNIRGGTGHSTKILLNGTNITEAFGGYLYNSFSLPDLIESVAVIQSPINARYGNSDGGLVTAVTSRGSNTFSGTIRGYFGRDYWSILDQGYPRRDDGYITPLTNLTSNDSFTTKRYQVTIKGPIWKDHITFAYGADLRPVGYSTPLVYGVGSNDGRLWADPTDTNYTGSRVGTFFQAENGDIIRKPEMYLFNTPDGYFNREQSYTYNQFTIFGQINPQHQIEWNYTQSENIDKNNSRKWLAQDADWHTAREVSRYWNLSYKAIIGSSGLFEARYGKSYQAWLFGDNDTASRPPIRSWTIASRLPKDGNFNNHDFSNYWANGYVSAYAGSNIPVTELPIDKRNPYPSARNQLGMGMNEAPGDGGGSTTMVFNYQHVLNTSRGNHMIDLGMQSDQFRWNIKAGATNPDFFYDAMGRIALDLAPSDIYNPNGPSGVPASYYAGKFIVFNTTTAWLRDVDPWAVDTLGITNRKYIDIVADDPSTWGLTAALTPYFSGPMPRVVEQFGAESGDFDTNVVSFYINDLWSINDHHSIQGGLRVDNFEVKDTVRSILKYTMPTLRFEYKWDIHGDQSRLLSVSWGQFHSVQPAGVFAPMATGRKTNNRTRYWSVGSSRPYLVDYEEFLRLDNYGYTRVINYAGENYQADPDWKAPISTEIAVGMRRSLSKGGFWKLTYVQRAWINDFDFYPGEIFTTQAGTKTFRRIFKNAEGYDRTYKGVEIEWDVPFHKRISFGGSYTYARLMANTPDRTDSTGSNEVGMTPGVNLDAYWDEVTGGRDVWRPSRLRNSEHMFKFYLMFDFKSGRADSSLSFLGNYTSGSLYSDAFNYRFGFPNHMYPDLMTNPGTGVVPGTTGNTGFANSLYIPFNNLSSYNDTWGLNARYMLSIPLVSKIVWFATITVSSPFNHRGRASQFSVTGADTQIVNRVIEGDNVAMNDPYQGIWRSNGEFRSLYTQHQGGRSFSLETGLRF